MIITGVMEEIGRAPGLIKWFDEGGNPKAFDEPGVEKSSISLLNRIPVREPITQEPNLPKSVQ